MGSDDIERIYASDGADFRAWMAANHATAAAVWLVFYKKDSGKPSVSWSDAVDEALCFGWIDSKVKSVDDDRHEQYFTARGYEALSDSAKRGVLEWIALAKRPETRARRIAKAASEISAGRSPLG